MKSMETLNLNKTTVANWPTNEFYLKNNKPKEQLQKMVGFNSESSKNLHTGKNYFYETNYIKANPNTSMSNTKEGLEWERNTLSMYFEKNNLSNSKHHSRSNSQITTFPKAPENLEAKDSKVFRMEARAQIEQSRHKTREINCELEENSS
jgi:hypothetical protein